MSTIGVAIAIPEPWASELQDHRTSFGDTRACTIPTHLTLVPPTQVSVPIPDVEAHLGEVAAAAAPFRLHLRGTASFRPVSPVVFIVVREGISACELLAKAALEGPLAQERAFPYHPHVTVAHDVDEASLDRAYEALQDFDCAFDVHRFQLYVHGEDGVWRVLRSFELTG